MTINGVNFTNIPNKKLGLLMSLGLTQTNIQEQETVEEYLQSERFYKLLHVIDIDWDGMEVAPNVIINNTADLINWLHTLPTKGDQGISAYQVAINNGFEGTEEQWLQSLIGPQGPQGETGPEGPQGPAGQDGANGQDGAPGLNGITPHIDPVSKHWMIGETDTNIVAEGQNGTNGQDGTNGQNGSDGITPHIDLTTGNWFIGETDTNVHAQGPQGQTGATGATGADGKSAYDIAVEKGFEGTPEEWIASLKGETGTFDYSDLADYATKTELPKKVSDLTNDAGYLTQHQSLADYATKNELNARIGNLGNAQEAGENQEAVPHTVKSYVDKKISDVIGAAPSTLDTLEEIASALENNATMLDIANAIETKANTSDIPTKVSDLNNDSGFQTNAQVDAKLGTLGTTTPVYSFESYNADGSTKYGEGTVSPTGETNTDVVEVIVITNEALDPNAADFVGQKFWINDQAEVGDTLYQLLDGEGQQVGIAVKITAINVRNLTVKEALDLLGNTKANKGDSYTKQESDAKYLTQHQDISGKANVGDSYTKQEADSKFLTDHQDISGKANLSLIGNLGNKVEAQEAVYYTAEEIAAAQEGDDAYGKTTEDIKTPAVEAVPYTNVGEVLTDIKTQLGGITMVKITQSAYDLLATKDPNTLYVITED